MLSCFHIRSSKFPVLQEDHDECCNPGTYGKSLANYLQKHLETRGYEIPSSFAEDFGWWIEIKTPLMVSTNIILRRAHENRGLADFAITLGNQIKKWSWKRFRFVDISDFQDHLASDVLNILSSDADIELVANHLGNYPDHRLRHEESQKKP